MKALRSGLLASTALGGPVALDVLDLAEAVRIRRVMDGVPRRAAYSVRSDIVPKPAPPPRASDWLDIYAWREGRG